MSQENEIEILLDAVNNGQEIVRAFDLKAEILTGILTLLIGMVAFTRHDVGVGALKWLELAIIIAAFITMLFLALVLYPTNNPLERVKKGTYTPRGVYYVSGDDLTKESVSDIANKVSSTNWRDELVFELMKVSSIRERKNYWFKAAIWAAEVTFGLLLVHCIAHFV